jgi:hypothetical protein
VGPIVHIGYHKTATSWFQKHVYPHVTSHRYIDRRLVRSTFLGGDAFGFDPQAARRALALDEDLPPPILCEEDLSGVLHNGPSSGFIAREVARRLHVTMPEARVVIFVRAQAPAALSWYQQYLREGGTAGLHRYLFPEAHRHLGHDRPFKVPRFCFSQLDYQGLVERYDALFGAERVIVLPYEAMRDASALLRRMATMLDADLPIAGRDRINNSYRAGLLPLLRFANMFTRRSVVDKMTIAHLPYWYTARKALFRQLNRLPLFGQPPRAERALGQPTIDWIAQRYWRSNRWLQERIGIDLGPLGYPVDPPAAEVARPPRALPLKWVSN